MPLTCPMESRQDSRRAAGNSHPACKWENDPGPQGTADLHNRLWKLSLSQGKLYLLLFVWVFKTDYSKPLVKQLLRDKLTAHDLLLQAKAGGKTQCPKKDSETQQQPPCSPHCSGYLWGSTPTKGWKFSSECRPATMQQLLMCFLETFWWTHLLNCNSYRGKQVTRAMKPQDCK